MTQIALVQELLGAAVEDPTPTAVTELTEALYELPGNEIDAETLLALAGDLTSFGHRLGSEERANEAILLLKGAIGCYRPLAEAHPAEYGLALAGVLRLLGGCLGVLDREDLAIEPLGEAVAITRGLAQMGVEAWRPELADTLTMRALLLAGVDRLDDAVTSAVEAAALYRQMHDARIVDCLPQLAKSLTNLGVWLGEIGRTAEAVERTSEAVSIYRSLAGNDAEAARSDLAVALSVLSTRLQDGGHTEESIAAAVEASALHREVGGSAADKHLPSLAEHLYNSGVAQAEVGHHDEAIRLVTEAAEGHRHLASIDRRYLIGLATHLSLIGSWLGQAGDNTEAGINRLAEAVDLFRQLSQEGHAFLDPMFATALGELAALHLGAGRFDDATGETMESLRLFQELAAHDPDTFQSHVDRMHRNLTMLQSQQPDRQSDRQAMPADAHDVALADFVAANERVGEDPSPAALQNMVPVTDALLSAGVPDGLATGVAWYVVYLEAVVDRSVPAQVAQSTRRLELALELPSVESPILGQLHRAYGARLASLDRAAEAIGPYEKAVELFRSVPAEWEDKQDELARALHGLARCQRDLGELAAAVGNFEETLRIRRELVSPSSDRSDLAGALLNLGAILTRTGQSIDGLGLLDESVDEYRRLVAFDAGKRAQLAAALNNRGLVLDQLGKPEQAVASMAEAVEIRRGLVRSEPDALVGLAETLSNFGPAQAALGRWDKAEATLDEAILILRGLVELDQQTNRPRLARALANLAKISVDIGQPDHALGYAREAEGIFRLLEKANPVSREELASVLTIVSSAQGKLGRSTEALSSMEEAVEIRVALAKDPALSYQVDLARSLTDLAACLAKVGRHDEALQAAQEAVGLQREFPEGHENELATSLTNIGVHLADVGRHEVALRAAEEAVAVRRVQAEQAPARYLPDLAASLVNLGAQRSKVGERDQAVVASQEAVDMLRTLAKDAPQVYTSSLAAALSNLGRLQADIGVTGAVAAATEAVDLYRPLAETNPSAFKGDLAGALSNFGDVLDAFGRAEEAVGQSEASVSLLESLAEDLPAVHRPGLAVALNELGLKYMRLDRPEEAFGPMARSAEIFGRLVIAGGEVYIARCGGVLSMLSTVQNALGLTDAALESAEQSVELYRSIVHDGKPTNRSELSAVLHNYGLRLQTSGRSGEAIAVLRESLEIRRELAEHVSGSYEYAVAASLDALGSVLNKAGRSQEALRCWGEGLMLSTDLATRVDTLRRLLVHPPSSWPADLGGVVANRLSEVIDELGAQQLTIGGRADRRRLHELTTRLCSLATVFLARDHCAPRLALRWVNATSSLEAQLVAERRSPEVERLRHRHGDLARELAAATSIVGERLDDASATESVQPRRKSAADVLRAIRAEPEFGDFLVPESVEHLIESIDGPTAVVACGTAGGVVLTVDPHTGVSVSHHKLSVDMVIDEVMKLLVAEANAAAVEDQDAAEWAEATLNANVQLRQLVTDHLLTGLAQAAPTDGSALAVVPIGFANWLPVQAAASLAGQSLEIRPTLTWRPAEPPQQSTTPTIVFSDGQSPESGGLYAAGSLGEARAEAMDLAALVGVDPLVDSDATPKAVLDQLNGSSYVHFACHGVADLTDPDRSGLLLNGETLTLRQLNRQLAGGNPPVFVGLSACQTARSDASAPEQDASLASLFLAHGSRAVLATHWNVHDEIARLFSTEFNAAWRVDGVTVGTAYDTAIRAVSLAIEQNVDLPTILLGSLLGFALFGDRDLRWPISWWQG